MVANQRHVAFTDDHGRPGYLSLRKTTGVVPGNKGAGSRCELASPSRDGPAAEQNIYECGGGSAANHYRERKSNSRAPDESDDSVKIHGAARRKGKFSV